MSRNIPRWVLVRKLEGGGRVEETMGVAVFDVAKLPPDLLELVRPDGEVLLRYALLADPPEVTVAVDGGNAHYVVFAIDAGGVQFAVEHERRSPILRFQASTRAGVAHLATVMRRLANTVEASAASLEQTNREETHES